MIIFDLVYPEARETESKWRITIMENKRILRNRYTICLFAFGIAYISACVPGTVGIDKTENKQILSQDLHVLKNSNGKIVYEKIIKLKDFKDSVECFKIKYLSDGLKVVGYIFKPKDGGSKYPVMIFNRGGNREYGKITEKRFRHISYLASNNYVVLASQYRGNDGGQGREEFGGKDVNDVLNLIPLAKSLPFANPDKIVMLGFSRGGMMTYLAIKKGAEIKAAAVVGGVTDLIQWDQERESIGEKVLEQLISPHNREEYKKRSAYYWPERINIPILILHGEKDWRVRVTQAKKISKKLTELGKVHKFRDLDFS